MLLSQFDYELPEDLIAQTPPEKREQSRLLVLNRRTGEIEHRMFPDIIDYLYPGDLLVMNDTRVSAVRLFGQKKTGGIVEALLTRNIRDNVWEAIIRPARRLKEGTVVEFGDSGLSAEILERTESGGRILDFGLGDNIAKKIQSFGQVPLPPYIHKVIDDPSRYQTVYAREPGSAAAPTAGFHLTPELLKQFKDKGVKTAYVTLHVGIATFRPVRTENIDDHVMHTERISISDETAEAINSTKGRIIAIGTTTARVLESAAVGKRQVAPVNCETGLYITPGYDFKIMDAIITNFHMPKSTLLIMISAFAGRETVLNAYEAAKAERYRFLSFGDAMFIF